MSHWHIDYVCVEMLLCDLSFPKPLSANEISTLCRSAVGVAHLPVVEKLPLLWASTNQAHNLISGNTNLALLGTDDEIRKSEI